MYYYLNGNMTFNEQIKSLTMTENYLNYKFNTFDTNVEILDESFIGNTVNFVKMIFKKAIKFIIGLWKTFIKIVKKIIEAIKNFFIKKNSGLSENKPSHELKGFFAFSTREQIVRFNSTEQLYNSFKMSLSRITDAISKSSKSNIDHLERVENEFIKNSNRPIMEKIQFYDQLVYYFENDPDTLNVADDNEFSEEYTKRFVLQAPTIFDSAFIENALSFNFDDIEKIASAEKSFITLYELFKNASADYMYDFIKRNEIEFTNYARYFNVKNDSLWNLQEALQYYTRDEFNDFFKMNAIPRFPNTEEGKKDLQKYLNLMIKKNISIKECLENLIRLDGIIFTINTKDNFLRSKNKDIEYMVSTFSQSIKNNTNRCKINVQNSIIYDFSKVKSTYGKVLISKYDMIDMQKLFEPEYSTALYYYATNFDITIMTHGAANTPIYKFAEYYNEILGQEEKRIFREVYKSFIDRYQKFMGKRIEDIYPEEETAILKQGMLSRRNYDELIQGMHSNGLKFSKIDEKSFIGIKRWRSVNPINILESSENFYDIELLMYKLIKHYRKINLNICNPDGFLPTYKLINDPSFTIYMPTRSIIR